MTNEKQAPKTYTTKERERFAHDVEQDRGNWKKFNSFAWHDKPCDPGNWYHWCLFPDPSLTGSDLDASNLAALRKELEHYTDADNSEMPQVGETEYGADLCFECHGSFAYRHNEVITVRVLGKDGLPTAAYCAVKELENSLADCSVLDEEDYSAREHETLYECITDQINDWLNRWGDGGRESAERVYERMLERDSGAFDRCETPDTVIFKHHADIVKAAKELGLYDPEYTDCYNLWVSPETLDPEYCDPTLLRDVDHCGHAKPYRVQTGLNWDQVIRVVRLAQEFGMHCIITHNRAEPSNRGNVYETRLDCRWWGKRAPRWA